MRCLIFCRRQTLMLFNNVSSHCDLKCAVIVSKENKKTHRALNNDRNPQNNQSKRCDYLVENEDKKVAYVIELKGTDLPHALEQIEATIQLFSQLFTQNHYKVLPRIVYGSNTHAVNDTRYRNFLKKYPKAKIQSNIIEETI